jgi:hypothetical protein
MGIMISKVNVFFGIRRYMNWLWVFGLSWVDWKIMVGVEDGLINLLGILGSGVWKMKRIREKENKRLRYKRKLKKLFANLPPLPSNCDKLQRRGPGGPLMSDAIVQKLIDTIPAAAIRRHGIKTTAKIAEKITLPRLMTTGLRRPPD